MPEFQDADYEALDPESMKTSRQKLLVLLFLSDSTVGEGTQPVES
jgi:hypothetical protein